MAIFTATPMYSAMMPSAKSIVPIAEQDRSHHRCPPLDAHVTRDAGHHDSYGHQHADAAPSWRPAG